MRPGRHRLTRESAYGTRSRTRLRPWYATADRRRSVAAVQRVSPADVAVAAVVAFPTTMVALALCTVGVRAAR